MGGDAYNTGELLDLGHGAHADVWYGAVRRIPLLLVVIGLCACSRTQSSPTTTTSTPRPAVTQSPSTSSSTTSTVAAAQACPSPVPVRPGAQPREVVCVSRKSAPPIAAVVSQDPGSPSAGPEPPPFYVELVSDGQVLADLSKIPAGAPLVGTAGRIVEMIAPVDFDGDGTESLVVAVLAVGASTGPLDVAVLSFRGVDVAVDFREGTQRGGTVRVEGNELVLETGSYAAGDPGCCPSGVLHQRIGWNPAVQRVEVREQSTTPVSSTTS